MKKKEYAVGEVFRNTDGKAYRCVEGETCEGCAFTFCDSDCGVPYCSSVNREDVRNVKYIMVTEPAEGMLFRAENGRMYRLMKGDHWLNSCTCDDDSSLSCAVLDCAVFGGSLSCEWYWAPVEEDAPAPVEPPKPVESPKPVEPPKRHIEIAVVKVEGDNVTFRIVEQTHRCNGFSRQNNPHKFTAANGFQLRSAAHPEWGSDTSALYCRGFERNDDNFEIVCSAIEFVRISVAVAEYNATDGRGYEKPWPSVGDKYFCIAAEGKVDRLTFTMDGFDRKAQDFGNFFRTKEEAEAAIERVKQALKK